MDVDWGGDLRIFPPEFCNKAVKLSAGISPNSSLWVLIIWSQLFAESTGACTCPRSRKSCTPNKVIYLWLTFDFAISRTNLQGGGGLGIKSDIKQGRLSDFPLGTPILRECQHLILFEKKKCMKSRKDWPGQWGREGGGSRAPGLRWFLPLLKMEFYHYRHAAFSRSIADEIVFKVARFIWLPQIGFCNILHTYSDICHHIIIQFIQ